MRNKVTDSSVDRKELLIPTTVRMGVTGHRKLANEQLLRRKVKDVLRRIDQLLDHTPHLYVVLSPLAEGADRLVATEIVQWPVSDGSQQPRLEVVLPLPEEDYLQDFETQESKEEFKRLLGLASPEPRALKTVEPRPAAYEQVGQYVVDNCDVLIAVWSGKPSEGRGGTAEIVEYALKTGRSVFWINSENGEIGDTKKTRERLERINEEKKTEGVGSEDHALDSLRHLDAYNGERLGSTRSMSAVEAEFGIPGRTGAPYTLPPDVLKPLHDNMVSQYARADFLAAHYQTYHVNAGVAIYLLAAAAVATVTVQALLFPLRPALLWVEVGEIAAILVLLALSWRREWHRKWIDYRFVAERLRAAIFLWVAGIECEPPKTAPPPLSLSYRPDDWMVKAFASIWDARPKGDPSPTVSFENLRNFLLAAWIEDQISFYKSKSVRQRAKHTRLASAGAMVFALTLVVAIVHAGRLEANWRPELATLTNILASWAIVLPAAGAAIASIRIHREYLRNSERYRHMVDHLTRITGRIEQSEDRETLVGSLEEANELMLLENQDWRVIFRFQVLRP
ncbi:MAG: hypothetical protein NTX17_04275 [Candidatus Eisenbacteria bacterium]|nr:hypothetical protein [Candidatus Eisenbacteria bacterium]